MIILDINNLKLTDLLRIWTEKDINTLEQFIVKDFFRTFDVLKEEFGWSKMRNSVETFLDGPTPSEAPVYIFIRKCFRWINPIVYFCRRSLLKQVFMVCKKNGIKSGCPIERPTTEV